jgi:cell division protein FtsB
MAQGERGGRPLAGLSARRILIIAALFIIAYFGVSIAGNAITRYELAREQQRLRREIAALEDQQRRLEALRAYMETDEFIERAAREEGLVRPGDTSVVVASAPQPSAPEPPPGRPWWERYFGPEQR